MALPRLPRLPVSLEVSFRGRPLWEVEFRDGRVVDERDTDWLHLDHRGQRRLTLWCPDGRAPTLTLDDGPSDALFFQFKCAVVRQSVAFAPPEEVTERRRTPEGVEVSWTRPTSPPEREAARLAALPRRPAPPPAWARPLLSRAAHLAPGAGETEAYVIGSLLLPHWATFEGEAECVAWEVDPLDPRAGNLVGPFRDNVLNFGYRRVGRLHPGHLGMVQP